MGCGTGVLAILSEKKGAREIMAVDIDPWSVENSAENLERNGCENIMVKEGDIDILSNTKFDIIIANINRNVLLRHIPVYADLLKTKSELLLSGFYSEDIPIITDCCRDNGLSLSKKLERNNWVALKFLN